MTALDILLDTVKRLEHNTECLMRGIHADFTLIKKEDLRILLDDHKRVNNELLAAQQIGPEETVWAKLPPEYKQELESRNPEESRKEFQQDFSTLVGDVEVIASTMPNCEHEWNSDKHGKCTCTKCGGTGRWFCGGEILPGAEYVPLKLDQDFDKP